MDNIKEPIFEVRMNDAPKKPAFKIFLDGHIEGFPEKATLIINMIGPTIWREKALAYKKGRDKITSC